MRLREILNRKPLAQVREQLPYDVARPTRSALSQQRNAMLLVQAPDVAQRDRSDVSGEAKLGEASRQLDGLSLREGSIPVA